MREIDIVLTSCIFPNTKELNPELSINERINDTSKNIFFLYEFSKISNIKLNLFFIDSSLSENKNSVIYSKLFDSKKLNQFNILPHKLNINEKKEIFKRGKGYAEMLMIKKYLKLRKSKSNYFIKISGRYRVKNLGKILNQIKSQKKSMYIDYSKFFKKCSTFFYASDIYFFEKYFFKNLNYLNDSKGKFLEKLFLKIIIQNNFNISKIYPKPKIGLNLKSGSHKSHYSYYKQLIIKLIYHVP